MKYSFILLTLFWLSSCYNQEKIIDKNKILGNDYRLFQQTPAWDLAKAVSADDASSIKAIIADNKVKIDYPDPRFGQTLLNLAVVNQQYDTAKLLLDLGADPNKKDTYSGGTPIISAANVDDARYLKLLLDYNGDPNSYENIPTKGNYMAGKTVLLNAISLRESNNMEKIKMLVAAGVDINFQSSNTISPLNEAIAFDRMDIALYLLEKGADFKKPLTKDVDGKDEYILTQLRKSIFDLDSEQYVLKMKIVSFLKKRGLDYDKEPIPEFGDWLGIIKDRHPDDWEEYIKILDFLEAHASERPDRARKSNPRLKQMYIFCIE